MSRDVETLLSVENVKTQFDTDGGLVKAVDDVSFEIGTGETVAVVGESGSGKTVMSESITKIIDMPPGEIPEGTVTFDGMDLTAMNDKQLQNIRGNRISHIFQNPQNGLNPVYTVGTQVGESIKIHNDEDLSKKEIREEVVDLLDRVGIPEAPSRIDDYPQEFSGGQKQRVLIAMALAGEPDLLIADEPTTALDVTIQAQILNLLEDLQEEFGMSILFITHDLAVVSEIADYVVVMYAGKVMERGKLESVFRNPSHPYTDALMKCLPGRGDEMNRIRGSLPSPISPPDGCRFHPRCDHAVKECSTSDQPPMYPVTDDRGTDHEASCVYYGEEYDPSELEFKRETPGRGDEARADGGSPNRAGGEDGGSPQPDAGTKEEEQR